MGGLSAPTDTSADDATLLARAYLSRVAEPGNAAVWAWVARVGPVEAARTIRTGQVPGPVGSATAARAASVDAGADLEAADRLGLGLLVPEDPRWPTVACSALEAATERLLLGRERRSTVPTPPLALWWRGDVDLLGALIWRSVAVIGSRASSAYGEHVAADLAYEVARRGVPVVSGGAYGIDACAHRGALAADGVTVLVSAGGLDRPYPSGNATLFERVAASGLLISESPPGAAPHRSRFLTRNRLIAAFSSATLVVEAAGRSGALNTAHHARTLGRPVLVVPGPITSAASIGCHDLLRIADGSVSIATSARDVIEVVGEPAAELPVEPGEATASPSNPAAAWQRAFDALDTLAQRVTDGFPANAAVSEDELGRRSGVTAPEVIRALVVLRAAGLVRSAADGHRLIRPGRPTRTDRAAVPGPPV